MTNLDPDAIQQRSRLDRLFATIQWFTPTRLLSHAMHHVAGSRRRWLKRFLIRAFCRFYKINLADAAITDPREYPSFNAFFTRALRADARPVAEQADTLVSPVDGRFGACGEITAGRLLQTKGATYTVADLLRDDNAAAPFLGGSYATIYLAPNNYHRVHMPIAGTLQATHYLPGRLFGVNPRSVRSIPRLFTRNERLACHFDTAVGPMAVVLVSAFCVGGIETVWSGPVTPPHLHRNARDDFAVSGPDRIELEQAAELGRFNLGSTIILLFGAGTLEWHERTRSGRAVQLGQALATLQYGI